MQTRRPVILVVEDDATVCEMLQILLEGDGYVVECAADGHSGLTRLAGDIDLVLLGLMMPGMDGLELCRLVRAYEGDVYLPIIMLTALTDQQHRHAGFAAGADDYVTKPFDTADLLDRVEVWVRTRQRLKAAHEQVLRQQARLREMEQRVLRERLAQDEAVLAMARTASHGLNQPLTLLLGVLELWEEGQYPGDSAHVRADLQAAATDLAARIAKLGRVVRYETTERAGLRVLDLARAQEAPPASAVSA